jgi:hypothetical protein
MAAFPQWDWILRGTAPKLPIFCTLRIVFCHRFADIVV